MTVIDEIASERRRQIEVEGFTPEHDDGHTDGSLARAAMAYAQSGSLSISDTTELRDHPPTYWPWRRWWNPVSSRHDLIRAAALIVAEIERLDRAEKRKSSNV